jgi:tryptophan-rich sensory protein
MPNNFKQWGMLVTSLIFTHGVGLVSSYFTIMSVTTWYVFLEKPEFAPPDTLFMPVWLLLYTLMAIAFYLVWRESTWRVDVKWGIRWYLFQLGLNALWSVLFFGLENPFYASIEIVFLLAAICITTYYFFRVSKIAGALMVPYIAWVAFASLLNLVIVILN